jgi:hypothetical protein
MLHVSDGSRECLPSKLLKFELHRNNHHGARAKRRCKDLFCILNSQQSTAAVCPVVLSCSKTFVICVALLPPPHPHRRISLLLLIPLLQLHRLPVQAIATGTSFSCTVNSQREEKRNLAKLFLTSSSSSSQGALVAPLLTSTVDEEADSVFAYTPNNNNSRNTPRRFNRIMGSDDWNPRFMESCAPWLRAGIVICLQHKTAADVLPSIFHSIVTHGKVAAVSLITGYFIFLALWLPFWLLSFVTSEWGIYVLSVLSIFYLGRCIIRLLAFPGASQKVTHDMEHEFAKYSVRVLESAVGSLVEVCTFLTNPVDTSRGGLATYELPTLWRRAKMYRNRVLSVYLEVLLYLYQQPAESTTSHSPSPFTKHGNNRLMGDIGNLSGLTVCCVKACSI